MELPERYQILEAIGLGKNEIKVYVRLLQRGPSTAGEVAEKMDIHRPNVYDALEKLIALGLVTYIFQNEKKIFQATDPAAVCSLMEEKKLQLSRLVPELKMHAQLAGPKPKAHIFEGIAGIKAMTDDQLASGAPIYSFGIPRDVSERMKSFVVIYHERRMRQKQWQYHLYNENAQERIAYLNTLPCTRAAFLPKEYDSPATTNVYDNKVSFFIWADEPFGVIIDDERMAASYTNYFKLLWKFATGEELK
ncbi:MAG: helix-turn-helix domain-containing protein [Candidatus Woesearchaeota archaeon]|nr:helix-turn-helix domain-containing protein [Candidatus Woesearchaeota archaeon]